MTDKEILEEMEIAEMDIKHLLVDLVERVARFERRLDYFYKTRGIRRKR